MTSNRSPRTPSYATILSVTEPDFLDRIRESEYVRLMETRLELESLVVTDDPAYHPS